MSKKRNRDYVANNIYSRHLYGDSRRFLANTANSEQAVLQRMYTRVLTELSVNRFKWSNLPSNIDVRFMELTLFHKALAVFTHLPDYDRYVVTKGMAVGAPNVMENPTRYRIYGNRFISRDLSSTEVVPIWSNYMRTPDIDIVLIYAKRLSEIDTTLNINSKQARRTKIATMGENQILSVENVLRQIDEGQPVIRVKESLDGVITNLDLGMHPDHIEKMHIYRTRVWNECMGLLGIDNANQDKKERLVADEVDANTEQVDMFKRVNLNTRKTAAEEINEKYGLNVSVDYYEENVSPMIVEDE